MLYIKTNSKVNFECTFLFFLLIVRICTKFQFFFHVVFLYTFYINNTSFHELYNIFKACYFVKSSHYLNFKNDDILVSIIKYTIEFNFSTSKIFLDLVRTYAINLILSFVWLSYYILNIIKLVEITKIK